MFIGCATVDMYAKCGLLAKSHEIFNKIPLRDVALWNALITGYVDGGRGEDVMLLLEEMKCDGISANSVTFVGILKAWGGIRCIEKGQSTQSEIVKKGLDSDPLICNSLVDLYAKCGFHSTARELFNRFLNRDIVTWNTLIGGYVECGYIEDAFDSFDQMQNEGISLNGITSVGLLKACSSVGFLGRGKEIHVEVAKKGLEIEAIVMGSLVDMYAKCGALSEAQEMFERNVARDVVSWTSLISGYAEHVDGERALTCFEQMQGEGVTPNAVTLICALKACSTIGAPEKGKIIHAEIERQGLLESDIVVGNSLVDMYARCGLLVKAQKVLEELHDQNVITWNALISGYTQHDECHEALNCLHRMQIVGICPNMITFICILRACGHMGALNKGKQIHREIVSRSLLEKNSDLVNALVDMYAKCGALEKAQEVFDKLLVRDAVSWNALIAGYAEHDYSKEALRCFEEMQFEGVLPDSIAVACVLKACAHLGAFRKGQEIYNTVVKTRALKMNPFIRTTMIDLYGKGGSLDKGLSINRIDHFMNKTEECSLDKYLSVDPFDHFKGDKTDSMMLKMACDVLHHIGVVPGSKDDYTKSLHVLQCLCENDGCVKHVIASENIIPSLVRLSANDCGLRQEAISLLDVLATDQECQVIIFQ